jgi:hypothetical protein
LSCEHISLKVFYDKIGNTGLVHINGKFYILAHIISFDFEIFLIELEISCACFRVNKNQWPFSDILYFFYHALLYNPIIKLVQIDIFDIFASEIGGIMAEYGGCVKSHKLLQNINYTPYTISNQVRYRIYK